MTASPTRTSLRFFILLLLVNILWSTTFATNKYLLSESIGVPSLALVRHVIAASVVLLVVVWRRIPFPRGRDLLAACVLGLLGHAGAIPVEYFGTRLTTASNVSVLIATEAAQCVILSAVLLGEKISRRKVLALCLSLGGAGLVLWKDVRHVSLLGPGTVQGDLLILSAAVLYALYTINAKRLVARCHPYSVFAVACLFASGLLLVWAAPELNEHPPWTYSLRLWWWIFYLAVPCLAIPVILYYGILRHLSAGVVGSSLFLQPLLGVVCAAVFLGERIEGLLVVGGFVILLGLYVMVSGDRADRATS